MISPDPPPKACPSLFEGIARPCTVQSAAVACWTLRVAPASRPDPPSGPRPSAPCRSNAGTFQLNTGTSHSNPGTSHVNTGALSMATSCFQPGEAASTCRTAWNPEGDAISSRLRAAIAVARAVTWAPRHGHGYGHGHEGRARRGQWEADRPPEARGQRVAEEVPTTLAMS